ncbi:MAG: TonB-dependent receptor family protein [Candidatus Azobacteroides sp.]|nr:TonB-dependent receptor family protein [Candidatus Azobacteroides sp.]
MKTRAFGTFLFVAFLATSAFSQIKITGKVTDNKNAPLEFANVILQAADTLFGTFTNESGSFELQAIPGNDTLRISMLGYKPYEKEISLQSDLDLGEIQMEDLAIEMNEVVIKGQRITRMPDRFVVNLANDPTIVGKDGVDVLKTSPGVFIQERDGSISVNGKSGSQVYVNERPRHETGTDLIRYLQNLKAEDIVKIEILPNAGSEYDASVTGGIIKITLKNRRDDGMDGSAGASGNFSPDDKDQFALSPFFNMNYRINKLSLYTQLNYNIIGQVEHIIEDVDNWTINQNIHSVFATPQKIYIGQARMGGIYDISDKQSVGLEVNYSGFLDKNKNYATSIDITDGNQTDVASIYNGKMTIDNYSASVNYLLRLDSLGSMFKALLDYFHNKSDNRQNYNSDYSGIVKFDSIYRSNQLTTNNTYAVTVDWSHHFNNITALNVGTKYAHNEMNNSTLFEYQQEYQQSIIWNEIDWLSNVNSYTENISAVYGLFSSKIQKVSYSLGLRGEYTQTTPWSNKVDEIEKQHYFKLFPSINVMFPFGKHSVVGNYHRTITRPSFMQLNPFRFPGSEHLYIAGNPKLQPAVSDDGSVSLNLFYKYNLTAGVTNTENDFGRVRIPDPDEPGVIVQTTDNISKNTTWYLSFNGSISPTKWWQIYLNLTGKRNNLDVLGDKRSINVFSGYMNNTFSLPENFKLDISGFYQSPWLEGNMKFTLDPKVNVTLRKQFLKNRLTATLFVNNIFNSCKVLIEANEADFNQIMHDRTDFRAIGASLSYSFQSGKKIQDKKVETGAAEEKARLK